MTGCASSSDSRHAQQSPTIAPDAQPDITPVAAAPGGRPPQATSLLGQPLYPPPLPAAILAQRQEQLYDAQLIYDRDLHDELAIIWLGRRQAYLGDYRAAIDTFSNGLAILPESHRLLRHRGHRYITVREFDVAIADLSRAAALVESQDIPDEIEPDGQPNDRNIPTSTTNSNIYYHLGLAHYLQGEWTQAIDAYQRCLTYSGNDDMRVATTYWLYLSLRRNGDSKGAVELLQTISPEMDIIENSSYHRLLLVYRGDLDARALQPEAGVAADATIDMATIQYGLGARDLLNGDAAAATSRFQSVIDNTNWAAFGHIAAEADLARMQSPGSPQSSN